MCFSLLVELCTEEGGALENRGRTVPFSTDVQLAQSAATGLSDSSTLPAPSCRSTDLSQTLHKNRCIAASRQLERQREFASLWMQLIIRRLTM